MCRYCCCKLPLIQVAYVATVNPGVVVYEEVGAAGVAAAGGAVLPFTGVNGPIEIALIGFGILVIGILLTRLARQ